MLGGQISPWPARKVTDCFFNCWSFFRDSVGLLGPGPDYSSDLFREKVSEAIQVHQHCKSTFETRSAIGRGAKNCTSMKEERGDTLRRDYP